MPNASQQEQYAKLVQLRKQCNICQGLINPSAYGKAQYDSLQIGPWSRWQGNLQTNLMIIAQDWGTTEYFEKWKGFDQNHGNPTNENLMKLVESIGIKINCRPGVDQPGEIFLSNAILCLKQKGGLQGPVKDEWFQNCGKKFLRPLLQVVNPKVVVALGQRAFKAILEAYDIPYSWPQTYRDVVIREGRSGGKKLPAGPLLFPVYHCGSKIINMTRDMNDQLNDWKHIRQALQT